MSERKKRIATGALGVLVCAVLLAAVWNRTRFGLDVTDESYWAAEPYLVLKGAVPFVNLWSQTPATSLLIAPLVALYMGLTGGTEGLLLFLMYTAVVFRCAVTAGIWRLLRRRTGDGIAACFALALFCCDMGRIRGMNYNVLALFLLALAGAMAFRSLTKGEDERIKSLPALTGLVLALCTLAHSAQIINCVYFALLFLLLSGKGRRKHVFIPFLSVGFSAALVTVIGLEIAGRGRLFSGMGLLLKLNNYFRIGKLSISQQLSRTVEIIKVTGRPWLLSFACLLALSLLLSMLLRRGKKLPWRACLAISVLGAGLTLLVIALMRGAGRDRPTVILFFTAPLLLAAVERVRQRDALLLFFCFWAPCFLAWAIISINSHSPADYRYYTLSAGALLQVPLGFLALEPSMEEKEGKARVYRVLGVLPLALALISAAVLLKISYASVYRDAPITQLDYQVKSGVYKGLYTTREKGEAVERLETLIREKTAGADSVLICDLFPMGYLMADAPPCTPTVWDPCMYRYGFQDMTLYRAYFEREGRTPGTVLFINSEDLALSVDDPENAFAAFVSENYSCAEELGEGLWSMRVFVRKAES